MFYVVVTYWSTPTNEREKVFGVSADRVDNWADAMSKVSSRISWGNDEDISPDNIKSIRTDKYDKMTATVVG